MASQPNIEYEAAKFLHKLIQDSKDEPDKLATKLYLILQHMKASRKENSMPYQVISRAMETVVNQHGLDIESMKPPCNLVNSGPQIRDSISPHSAGFSQIGGAPHDSKSGLIETDSFRTEAFSSGRPLAGPRSMTNDTYPGSAPHRSAVSFDHESPSSIDTRSTNSPSYERHDASSWDQQATQKDSKKSSVKRKRPESSASDAHIGDSQQLDAHNAIGDPRKGKLFSKMEFPGPFPDTSLESSAPTTLPQRSVHGHLLSSNKCELTMGDSLSNLDISMQSGIPKDIGKSPILPMSSSSMPFKEHHLKQLRAQCLVFLAFRNGLMPKRLHLEIALGNILPTEGSTADGVQREFVDGKAKEIPIKEPSSNPDTVTAKASVSLFATASQTENSREEAGNRRVTINDEEGKEILGTGMVLEAEMQNQGIVGAPTFSPVQSQNEFSRLKSCNNLDSSVDNGHLHASAMSEPSIMGMNNQPRPEMIRWAAVGGQNEASRRPLSSSVAHPDTLKRNDSSPSPQYADSNLSVPWKSMQGKNNEKQRMVPAHDATSLRYCPSGTLSDATHSIRNNAPFPQLDKTYESEETNKFSAGVPPPKYTTTEKWIVIQQKRRVMKGDNWKRKQERVDRRIVARFNELKETVISSEDISAKTRSVIELKKLQLLELQRCLRSNILNEFFKPITLEIDRLKVIKKHRVGRRLKHVEKYEQRMKEERQKRVNERQKVFFSELEFHKERLDDAFKLKKERWKGFHRYVKEFHKRKERLYREKIDRIQREKINLLKINDVEGYLRMVQDVKSDRVKQLLKETEKYLQKLSAKLQEAKPSAKHLESDNYENQAASVIESSETEDESDQAKNYKESNEKYYLMAHSVKENIPEQPTGLVGGKLREYQMNGLRWLVSLYNNHLNGILADEMGLGKTVQVISLICYLMESKNDRGPFLVVVPSSVLPGWESELNFWAPGVNKIVYTGSPEERRRLFKETIVHQKFNVLLTTYEYLMNKHDRPKLSKVHWHYIIIDEGHRIKNASCKLNADLKQYHSSHRLLLTGTPLQNNLEELWALLNFLLPNIFNASEDFSQWFNKPFESNGDNAPDQALLSEEENLLIINRLHQVLRPFVLRRLKHKVENQLPEKIERLVRCEASAYQKLLMKRVEDNLGSLVNSKARSVHNSVMELRNICNHPYLSQLHVDEVDTLIPKHFLPPIVRLCGKLEMLDRLLPKLKATNHRVLFFSTMTRLLDVMEEYLAWKNYHYVRLDGHTSGQERGCLIEQFNRPDSPYFIFLLSIRAGGVGVNLQAADTVILFDTDWNPQVDLQAQARAHRIGQKKDVLVLRLETINTVEEQVRASAEHKLGVANQSITAGFFDNNTSAEDRREYLEALLRECKKEEDAPVLDDDALNDLLARSEVEIDVFESVDQKRREEEMATWKRLMMEKETDDSQVIPPLPSRIVTDDDLKAFNEAMKMYEVSAAGSESDFGLKRKAGSVGGFDAQRYGRGKRAREVRSYEEQWTEEEFEKMCQTESPDTLKLKEEQMDPQLRSESGLVAIKTEPPLQILQALPPTSGESLKPIKNDVTPPVKRGRGRPRRVPPSPASVLSLSGPVKPDTDLQKGSNPVSAITNSSNDPAVAKDTSSAIHQFDACIISSSDATPAVHPTYCGVVSTSPGLSTSSQSKGKNKKGQVGAEPGRRRGRKSGRFSSTVSSSFAAQNSQPSEQLIQQPSIDGDSTPAGLSASSEQSKPKGLLDPCASVAGSSTLLIISGNTQVAGAETGPSTSHCTTAIATLIPANEVSTPSGLENLPGRRKSQRSQSGAEPVRRMGRRHNLAATNVDVPSTQHSQPNESNNYSQTSVPQSMKIISAFVQGSATLKDASLTLDDVAAGFAPTIPTPSQPLPSTALSSHTEVPCAPAFFKSEGQNKKEPAEESAPRRRGRKRGISLASGSSNVYSQDKSPSLSENIIKKPEERSLTTAGQGNGVLQSRDLFSPDSKPEDQNDLSSATMKRNNLSVAASTLEKGAIEAHKSDRNASLAKKVEVSTPLVDLPATGNTTVIVLALKACSFNMDKGFVKPEAGASQPRFTIVSEAESTSHLGEDLIAPPGFDTVHAYTADDAVVEVPLPSKDSKGKEDDATANKSTFQTESRATVGHDQNLMDPVPVKILEEESTPPGFQTGGTCSSKTRAAGSVHSESRDASQEASSAQAEASEPPSGFCEESLPPGFGVAQGHLAEARNENVVLNEIGEVSLPPGFDANRESEDPLKKVQGASEAHTSCSRAPAVLEPEIGNVALDDGSKGKNDEFSITGNGIDVCKTNPYVESSTGTIYLSEKTVDIIAGVQKDADSLYITEHPDDVPNIAESMHQTMEEDKPQQEKQSTIIGGLKQQVEGKSADFGEACLRDYSSTEIETDANDTVHDTSEVMDMSAGMMPEICTDLVDPSRTADAVASSIPQIQKEVSLAGPSLAENAENRTQNSEAPSIPFTFQKDEAHSEKQYDTNDASSLHVEASNGDLESDLESNTEKSHGTRVREQEVFCVEMSGTDSRPTEEHIRSSDAGNDLSFVSKVDNSPGMSDVHKDGSARSLTETLARSSLLETDLEATFILSETEGQQDGVDSEIRQNSGHEASTGDTSCPLAPKEEEVSQRPSVATQPCSSCTISESEVPIDEADPEMLCDTSSPQAPQEGEMSKKPNAAAEPDSSCTVSGSEVLSDETDPEMLHDAVLRVSKDEIASSLDTHDQEHCHQPTDNADEEDVCTMPEAMVQHQNDPEVLPDVDCGVSEVKIYSPQGTEVHKESKEQTFQEIEEQDASSSPAAAVHVELNCTALGSEVQKDEADPEILPDTELSVPKNEVDAPYIPEELESQKPAIIMQPENPCNDEVLVEEADSEILPEEQKQCQEKKVFPEETANDMSTASSASMGAEGQYTANAIMPRGTDFPSAKDEIDTYQTCEDKGVSLELAIRAELKASDTLLDAHAQSSNEIGISQGCEETIVRDVKPRATQEQDESEKMIFGVQLEAASALLGFESQKNEVDASADVAASKYELGASQASCENQVMHSPTMECQENEGDAVVGDESRNTTDGTELEAAPMVVETEHKKNEHGESAEAGVPKHKVGDSESSKDQNAPPKATAGAQLLAASSIFHKDEAAAVDIRALLDDKSAALLPTLDQDGTQKLATDSPPKEASGALSDESRKDETESGILIDIKPSVDEENASQSPKN